MQNLMHRNLMHFELKGWQFESTSAKSTAGLSKFAQTASGLEEFVIYQSVGLCNIQAMHSIRIKNISVAFIQHTYS